MKRELPCRTFLAPIILISFSRSTITFYAMWRVIGSASSSDPNVGLGVILGSPGGVPRTPALWGEAEVNGAEADIRPDSLWDFRSGSERCRL